MHGLKTVSFLAAAVCMLNMPVYAGEEMLRTVRLQIENLPEDSDIQVRITDLESGESVFIPADSEAVFIETDITEDCLITLSSLPAGLMPSDEILLQKGQPAVPVKIRLQPFSVRIVEMMEGTDIRTDQGTYTLMGEDDEVLCEWQMNKEGIVLRSEEEEMEFHAGDVLILHQKEVPEGYSHQADQLIMIPEYQENCEEPLEFRVFLKEGEDETVPEGSDYVWTAAYRPYTDGGMIYDGQVETSKPEPAEKEEKKVTAAVNAGFSFPFVSEPVHSHSVNTTPAQPSKAGFYIRLIDENKNPLHGADIGVYDARGRQVDVFTADGTDHLVQNDEIITGNVYTIRQLSQAEGFTMSTVGIVHTAADLSGGSYPVISIVNRSEQKNEELMPQQKIQKASGWLVYAAGGTAIAAVLFAAAAFLHRKPAK